jgi:hypothetical protein
VMEFIRLDLRDFRHGDRIRAELDIEFAAAVKARLAAGKDPRGKSATTDKPPRCLLPKDVLEPKAKAYLEENQRGESTANAVTLERLARFLGCSPAKACGLDAWRSLMNDRRARAKNRAKVTSSNQRLNTIGRMERDQVLRREKDQILDEVAEEEEREIELERLCREQFVDHEPSPLEPDSPDGPPRRVIVDKQV